jgi:NADH:ubiquinone oxidoreductase subunit 5 (subunit L)/multisubunit Na+/H+ antiporter MnhA subunit
MEQAFHEEPVRSCREVRRILTLHEGKGQRLRAAGIFLLLRISPLLEYSDTVLVQAIWIGSLTALFAATTGLFQNDLKRVIAYSTCSQLGMLLVACGLTKGL